MHTGCCASGRVPTLRAWEPGRGVGPKDDQGQKGDKGRVGGEDAPCGEPPGRFFATGRKGPNDFIDRCGSGLRCRPSGDPGQQRDGLSALRFFRGRKTAGVKHRPLESAGRPHRSGGGIWQRIVLEAADGTVQARRLDLLRLSASASMPTSATPLLRVSSARRLSRKSKAASFITW